MDARSMKCRRKDTTTHCCSGYVQKEQPKALLLCTCPCHGDVEARRKENDERYARAKANAWQGHRPGYR